MAGKGDGVEIINVHRETSTNKKRGGNRYMNIGEGRG